MRTRDRGQSSRCHLEKGHRVAWVEEERLHLYWYPQHPINSPQSRAYEAPRQNSVTPVPMSIHILRLPRMPEGRLASHNTQC